MLLAGQLASIPCPPPPPLFPPAILATLGGLHARKDDEARAVHCYSEAHRIFPVDLTVISWLGAFHVRNEMYEKAVPYFQLAALVQAGEAKWALMVASCYRRTGDFNKVSHVQAANQMCEKADVLPMPRNHWRPRKSWRAATDITCPV